MTKMCDLVIHRMTMICFLFRMLGVLKENESDQKISYQICQGGNDEKT